MASGRSASKNGVPPAVIVVIVVLFVLFISWLGYANLAPNAPQEGRREAASPQMAENDAWIKQKAVECQGDFNKLSAEDQKKAQEITRNMAPMALKGAYQVSKH